MIVDERVKMLKGSPNAAQWPFFKSRKRHTGYGGARGGGKSWAARRKAVLLCLTYPDLNILFLRRSFKELDKNHTIPLIKELVPSGIAKYNKGDRIFEFDTGSMIHLGYCDNENDMYQYQGPEYQSIFFEEAVQFTEEQIRFLLSCNRSTRNDFNARAYYTMNPGGPSHEYFKRIFVDQDYDTTLVYSKQHPEGRPRENPDDYTFIQAFVEDCPQLMDNDPGYYDYLNSLPEYLRRAYLLGDWNIVKGQFFPEFRKDVHVCANFSDDEPIPAHWKRFVSIDWGYRDPCAVLWYAVGPDSQIFIYREMYVKNVIASEQAKMIRRMNGDDVIQYYVGSPDMWQKRGMTDILGGENVAEVYAANGVTVLPADNSRVIGWQRVRENLAYDEAIKKKPKLQICACCKNLIRTLPNLMFDEHELEDVSDKCEDHAPESLRYGLMSRPATYKPLPEERKPRPYNPLADPPKKKSQFLTIG